MNRRIDFDSAKASSPLDPETEKNGSGPTHLDNSPQRGRPSEPCNNHLEHFTLGSAVIEIGWNRQADEAHLADLILQLIGEAELKGIVDEKPKC